MKKSLNQGGIWTFLPLPMPWTWGPMPLQHSKYTLSIKKYFRSVAKKHSQNTRRFKRLRDIVIDTKWSPKDPPYIRQRLKEYNLKHLSEKDVNFVDEEFCFKIKDEEGNIIGGISGNTKMQSLYIQFLWVDENHRGKGFGIQLIKGAEKYAVEKKCRMIKVDTFSFQAPDFYKSLGYEVCGIIEDYPEGHKQYLLYKKLD
ncbi:GNAT family N-acetyltransferase [Robertmurraya massiliosenegalensis]|uniref:GNAT family N-acetyltransferase n=1 Tax=Robertmurraya massiliosenegalensis TaxID=1287657 RepID=UPI001F3DCA87|nr:GNAT family N-acetyltransferase [Robertmurraya massiliosenegalensis]